MASHLIYRRTYTLLRGSIRVHCIPAYTFINRHYACTMQCCSIYVSIYNTDRYIGIKTANGKCSKILNPFYFDLGQFVRTTKHDQRDASILHSRWFITRFNIGLNKRSVTYTALMYEISSYTSGHK